MFARLQRARDRLVELVGHLDYAVVTGTGIEIEINAQKLTSVRYDEIPGMPVATAPSHKGHFDSYNLSGSNLVVANGRFHYYEGYPASEVVFLVRLLALAGAKAIVLTNAAGGLNPLFKQGDLMVVRDHINMIPSNPLRGVNIDELGERFPDMSQPYAPDLIDRLKKAAMDESIELKEGVYVAIPGPSLETPAETRFLRMIGADAVGMSTVPEVIALNHMGVDCAAISVITNVNRPDCMAKTDVNEIIKQARAASKKLSAVLNRFFEGLT